MMTNERRNKTTAVLAHAWADGSSWNKVTIELQRRGFSVVAAQIPLTSFTDDVAALRRVLRRQAGPVVLVGHSYGGAVITAAGAGESNVKALVYIAAVVPDEGETVGEIFGLQPDSDGLLWLNLDAFRNAVAPDASSEDTALMAVTQKPTALKCLGEAYDSASVERKTILVPHRRQGPHGFC